MRTAWLIALFLAPGVALAQASNVSPTAGGFVVTNAPVRDGTRATADLPASQHQRNIGGRDGAGLCVYTSFWHAALWQAVSEVYGFRDWMSRYDGGSYPEKFEKTLAQYCREKGIPVPEYVQHTGGDEEVLRMALKTGRMVCVTYCGVDGPGRYGSEVIGHMVNLVHLDDSRACILDNNFPGTFLWMSRVDFLCRWRGIQADGRAFMARGRGGRTFPIGGGWAIVLLAPPPSPYPDQPPLTQFSAATCCGCDPCKCIEKGKCPDCCPVMFGQCSGGRCQIPSQASPQVRLIPFVAPAAPPLPDRMAFEEIPTPSRAPTAQEITFRPSPEFLWKDTPGVGPGWHCPNPGFDWGRKADSATGWGWVPKIEVGANEFPQGGVESEKLVTTKRYWINGAEGTEGQIKEALSLADDSGKFNLSIVGDSGFAKKVREDIAALSAGMRSKLHVQAYTAAEWQVPQFKLGAGVTLRKPARNRIGADVGSIPTSDYSAATLADLLTSSEGPEPRPTLPKPKPKDPTPKEPDQKKPDAEPLPTPTHTSPVIGSSSVG